MDDKNQGRGSNLTDEDKSKGGQSHQGQSTSSQSGYQGAKGGQSGSQGSSSRGDSQQEEHRTSDQR